MVKQGFVHVPQRSRPMLAENPPSLLDLCVQTTIDNLRYLGDVGETDIHLLERILPHCTVDQLMHIENETKERDLSQVTNKLWKKFYEVKFGAEHTNEVIEKLKRSKQKFSWKQLYEAKLEVQDKAQKQSLERLRQLYQKEDQRKQSRQIQICSKAPPSAKRRFFGGGYAVGSSVSNAKSNIMKKAKIEYLNSNEIKNRAAIKRNPTIQRIPINRVSSTSKPGISPYKPDVSRSNPGSSQLKDCPSARRDMNTSQFKGSASASGSSSASRSLKTDRMDDVKRNPGSSKGKATSLPGKNSVPRKTTEIDWDDDIKRKLSEFW